MPLLKIIRGEAPHLIVPVRGERTVIGRHPNCHVVLDNGAVSRHHAQILETHGAYYVEDLRSRNGTYVNGTKIEGRRELLDGDEIRLCDVILEFQMSSMDGPSTHLLQPNATASDSGVALSHDASKFPDIDDSRVFVLSDAIEEPDFDSSSKLKSSDSRSEQAKAGSVDPEIKLKAILELTRALVGQLGVDKVLPKVLETLFNIFPQADQGFALFREGDGPKMKVMATLSRAGAADIVAVSMTVVRHVVQTGEPLLSANIKEDPRFNKSASLARMRVRSIMCVPLLTQDGKALGVIQIVTRHEGREFSNDDHELLLSLAAQASMVIENAKLHTELLAQRDMERDLEFATQVQLGFLPKSRPKIEGYDFFDYYEPALRVGGDYFDYVQLSDEKIAIAMGDVAGKGVPAALLMARLYSTTRFQLLTAPNIAEAVRGLNREMSFSGLGHRFITFLVMVLDHAKNELTIVNAGHLSPLLRRKSGKVEPVGKEESNLPLGILPDITYQEKTIAIDPGELVLCYTDGVTEAINKDREIYGRPRLEALLKKTDGTVEDTVTTVMDEIEAFVDDSVARDDTCIVAFKRL